MGPKTQKKEKEKKPNETDFPPQHTVSGKFDPSLSWDKQTFAADLKGLLLKPVRRDRTQSHSRAPVEVLIFRPTEGPVTLNLTPPPPAPADKQAQA